MRRIARFSGAVMAALMGAVVLASPASAHAALLAATPAAGTHVTSAPSAVVLSFDETPQGRYSTIHVVGPDGQRRDSGLVRVLNDSVTESLGGTRPAGTYVVDWRVISADGHPVSGQLTFTADAATSALAARLVAHPTSTSTSSSTGIVVVVVIAAALLAIGLFFFRRQLATRRR